jgi:hypothetical protein
MPPFGGACGTPQLPEERASGLAQYQRAPLAQLRLEYTEVFGYLQEFLWFRPPYPVSCRTLELEK